MKKDDLIDLATEQAQVIEDLQAALEELSNGGTITVMTAQDQLKALAGRCEEMHSDELKRELLALAGQ
jgi:uncharacterized coiled-coil protein SlyX